MNARFKRSCRKLIAVVLGLFLGWMAADVAFDQLPSAAYGATSPATGAADHAHEEVKHSMEALKPTAASPWQGKLIRVAILLFLAAVVLGPIAQSLKSPEPPERDEHHGHDDHAHAAHGHDAHAAHGHAH